MPATKVRTSNTRLIAVTKVSVPAMSTIGYGIGVDESGRRVRFVGDQRPLPPSEMTRYAVDQGHR